MIESRLAKAGRGPAAATGQRVHETQAFGSAVPLPIVLADHLVNRPLGRHSGEVVS